MFGVWSLTTWKDERGKGAGAVLIEVDDRLFSVLRTLAALERKFLGDCIKKAIELEAGDDDVSIGNSIHHRCGSISRTSSGGRRWRVRRRRSS